jgi:hypothetical protein
MPVRGLKHDMSKFSWVEFWESVKYYNGKISPLDVSREKNGYSKAWLHHKGRNKHHFEYWYDFNTPDKTPVIPYKYTVEMICDTIAAGMSYMKKDWTPKAQGEYFERRKDLEYINDDIKNILRDVYKQLEEKGIDKTINKKNLRETYDKYVNKKENKKIKKK